VVGFYLGQEHDSVCGKRSGAPWAGGSSDPPAASSGSNPKAGFAGLVLCGGYSKGADHASVQLSAQSAPCREDHNPEGVSDAINEA
jgi:hypothetical protein